MLHRIVCCHSHCQEQTLTSCHSTAQHSTNYAAQDPAPTCSSVFSSLISLLATPLRWQ